MNSKAFRSLRFAGRLLRWGVPKRALLFGPMSLGDDLLCTAVLREARKRGKPFVMMTARPELFTGNQDPKKILPIEDDYVAGIRRLGATIVKPYYAGSSAENPNRDVLPNHHLISEMCRIAGLRGEIAIRPYLNLFPHEMAGKRRAQMQIAIHTSTQAAKAPFDTKDWPIQSWTPLLKVLRRHAHIIQLGALSDPPVEASEDLRGKTSIREAAAVIANSDLFIGLEGFLSHLARAVDCPGVVIIGGRTGANTVGYSCNTNLVSNPPCAPCGLRRGCTHNLMCMHAITHDSVLRAALQVLETPPPRPLRAETATIPN